MKCLTEAVLAQAPQHEYLLILPAGSTDAICCDSANVERLMTSTPCYSFREQFALPRILRGRQVDVLHSPHFNLPLRRVCSSVVTIHDVIYLACRGDLPSRLGRIYYRNMMRAAVRIADRVLTVSQWSRQDISRHLGCDPEKVEVVYPAVRPGFGVVSEQKQIEPVLMRLGIEEEFILYTGIYKPRKNHAALLLAFRSFMEGGKKASLVIAGPLGEGEQILRQMAARLGIVDRVVFTGFVSDEDLPALYTAARVYACPSLYEGFGFTVLEAMACGVPVVCAPETSLPEVAGTAALYANPRNAEEFGAAMGRAFSDSALREQLIERGFANVRRFSWQAAAARSLAAYESTVDVPLEKAVCV